MSEEMLKILNDLSKKETTELALQIMELTADNLLKDKEIEGLHSIIKEVREYIEENMSYIEKGKLEYIPSGEELLQILDKVEEK